MRGLVSIGQLFVLIFFVIFLFGDFFAIKKLFKNYGLKRLKWVFKKIEKISNRKKGN